MNGPPPEVVAASAYRRSLADDVAGAVNAGCSVAVIGLGNTEDVLNLTMVALGRAGVRVLTLRPPWDSRSFISQFAAEWRASGQDADLGAGPITLPKPSGERFAMLLHQAHLIPPETLRHLERLAQAWPGMQMVFAGLPGIADTVRAEEHPVLADRVSQIIEIPLADEMRRLQFGVGSIDLADAVPASSAVPVTSTWMTDEYPPIRSDVAPDQQAGAAVQTEIAQPSLPGRALGRVVTWSLAVLVAVAIMTITSVPRLPWTGRTADPGTQVALRDPAPVPENGPAENSSPATALPTAEPEPQVRQASPIAAASGQGAAVENLRDAPAPAVETPPPAIEPVQEAVPSIAPASPYTPTPGFTPAPTSTRPEGASHVGAEDSPGPVPRPSPNVPSTTSQSPGAPQSPIAPLPSSATPPSSAPSPSPAMADAMTRRGLAMLEIGDVSAARLLLARAAGAGSGPAALAMGNTFDAATLDRIGAVGILADPVVAGAWYRFALGLGEDRARAMIDALPIDVVTAKPKDAP